MYSTDQRRPISIDMQFTESNLVKNIPNILVSYPVQCEHRWHRGPHREFAPHMERWSNVSRPEIIL